MKKYSILYTMYNPNTGFRLKKGEQKVFLEQKWTLSDTDPKYLIPPDQIKSNYIKLPTRYLKNEKYHTKYKTKTINPDTGEFITYRTALRKDNFDIEYDKNEIRLIPKNKLHYEKTKDDAKMRSTWLKKETKAYNKAKEEDQLQVKKVYLPNKVMIAIDSPQFVQMIDDGFTYDEKKNLLRYPKYETVVEVKFPVTTADVKTLMDEKATVITLIVDGERTNIPIDTLRKTVEYINQVFFYKEHEGELRGESGGDHVKFGPAFHGTKNCVINELEKHCDNYNYDLKTKFYKLYRRYKYGVYGQDYTDIAKSLQLQIKVHLPNKQFQVFGKPSYKRATFDCYYDNNHVWVDEKTIESRDKPVLWKSKLKYKDLTHIQNICGPLSSPTFIEYKDRIEKLESQEFVNDNGDPYTIDYKSTHTTTPISYFTYKFLEQNDTSGINPRNYNLDAIKSICQHGIMFSTLLEKGFNHKKHLLHLDIKSAYDTYEKCEYYSGIPCDLTWCVKVDELKFQKQQEIIKNKEGFAYVKMKCIWSQKDIERWVSMPYLRFYMEKRKDPIEPIYFMLALNKTNLNLEGIKPHKRTWHKVLGNINRTVKTTTYVTTDGLLAQTSEGSTEEYTVSDCKGKLYRKYLTEEGVWHYYPHIAGYVQGYTEIRMEQMVLNLQLKPSQIKRVWVDGMYVQGRLDSSNFETLEKKYPEWHIGLVSSDHEVFQFPSEITYNAVEPVYFSTSYESRLDSLTSKRVMVKGVSGTGKSYLLKALYNQCPNALLLVPTNELKKRFEGTNVETIDMAIVRSHLYQEYSVILLDEYGIVSQETLKKLLDRINPDLLVVSGDEGQLRLIEGTPIDESKFDILVLEKIFRQYDPEFQRKLNHLRKTGEFDFKQKVDSKTAIRKKYIILSATTEERDKLNKLGFALNDSKDIKGVKVGSPVRFYKTTKSYNAGETGYITSIGKDIMIKKENGNDVKISIDQFKKYHKLAYSMTYHCVQGKTVSEKNIAINTTNLFDPQMKYVGCSRVVKEDQLFLLVG